MNERLPFNTTPIFQTPFSTRANEALFHPDTEYISRNDVHQPPRFVFSCIPKIPMRNGEIASIKTPTPFFLGAASSDFGTIGIDGRKMIETPLLQNVADEADDTSKPEGETNCERDAKKSILAHEQSYDVDLDATVSKYFSSESNDVKIMNPTEICTTGTKPDVSLFNSAFAPQTPTFFSQYHVFGNEPSNSQFNLGENNSYVSDSNIFSARNSNELYLSVAVSSGYVGAARYDMKSTVLEVMPDLLDNRLSSIINQLILEYNPTKLLISASSKEYISSLLPNKISGGNSSGSDGQLEESFLILLPPGDFQFFHCRRRLFNMPLPQFSQNSSSLEKDLYILSRINENDKNMVRAAGALLKYLEKKRISVELEDAMLSVPVLDIKVISLSDAILIDRSSLRALQIFCELSHPSGFKIGKHGSVKEGLSIYGLLNLCRSKVGSLCLRSWLLRPLKNRVVLQERHDSVEYFSKSSNQELVTLLQTCLNDVGSIKTILSSLRQSMTSVGEWKTLCKTIFAVISIGDVCRSRRNHLPIFKQIADVCTDEVIRVASWLHRIVDLEESQLQKRFVVKPQVNPELDEKKRMYKRLPEILSEVATKEMNRLRDHISECGCIYLPQIGYLLTTRSGGDSPDPKMEQLGFEFCFYSNGLGHYRNKETRELDRTLGDTECEIRDLESSVMNSLQESIYGHSAVLLQVVDLAAELDCLIALAMSARQFEFCRPYVTDESGIHIKKGRHPLQEICCSPFVPNDTEISGKRKRVTLITGPSACGKSIYMKQVALIVFMAQVGSFVPASSARIGLVDAIFTRLQTCESVGLDLSAFAIDLNQISSAVNMATPQSLIVIDEFGVGTNKTDGPALLTSLVNFYLRQGADSPLVLVSTSVSGIHISKLESNSNNLSLLTFETMEDNNKHIHLYQVVKGISRSSYAFEIGKSAGLPDEIVDRAKEILAALSERRGLRRMTSTSRHQVERHASIVNDFMKLDLENGDPVSFLSLLKQTAQ